MTNVFTKEDIAYGREQMRAKGEANLALGDRTLLRIPINGTDDPKRDAENLHDYADDIGCDYGTLMKYRRVSDFYNSERRARVASYPNVSVPYRVIQAAATSTRGNLTPAARWAALVFLMEKKTASYEPRITESEFLDSLGKQEERNLADAVQEALPLLDAGDVERAAEILSAHPMRGDLARTLVGWGPRSSYPRKQSVKAGIPDEDEIKNMSGEELISEVGEALDDVHELVTQVRGHGQFTEEHAESLAALLETSINRFVRVRDELTDRYKLDRQVNA